MRKQHADHDSMGESSKATGISATRQARCNKRGATGILRYRLRAIPWLGELSGRHAVAFDTLLVGNVLASHTAGGPRYGLQPLGTDIVLAADARPITAVLDSLQRHSDALQAAEVGFDLANRQFAFRRLLNAVDRIGSVFYRNLLAPSKRLFDASQHRFEYPFESLQIGVNHLEAPSTSRRMASAALCFKNFIRFHSIATEASPEARC